MYQFPPSHSGNAPSSVLDILQPLIGLGQLNIVSLALVSFRGYMLVARDVILSLDRVDERLATSFHKLTQLWIRGVVFTNFESVRCLVKSFPSLISFSISQVSWKARVLSDPPLNEALNPPLVTVGLIEEPVWSLLGSTNVCEELISWILPALSVISIRALKIQTDWIHSAEVFKLLRSAQELHLHLDVGFIRGESSALDGR